jgi:hypothetical protein
MSKGKNRQQPIPSQRNAPQGAQLPMGISQVPSLLDVMVDGKEYGSIVDKLPLPGANLLDEVVRAIGEISQVRDRPCIVYSGNVVRNDSGNSGVDQSDDLPFQELVRSIPAEHRKVDLFLSTRGGSGQQIARFVDCLRSRFDEVDFLIPSYCFSAGTLFALSGDRIWMTPGACLGPIDPQFPTTSGRFAPAQALRVLVEQLRQQGEDAINRGQRVPWTAVQIVNTIDKRELGEAITATEYATTLASEYLRKYKFKHWTVHSSSGQPVTDPERISRATEIAEQLASHERWKSHSHAISRDALHDQTKLHIDHPAQDLLRAMTRAWAIFTYVYERTPLLKIICSANYRYAKQEIVMGAK